MNAGASAGGEATATPTKDARPPSPSENVRRSGASLRQGGHHEPQKLMKTGLPLRGSSENGRSVRVGPLKGAAANVLNPEGGTTTCAVSIFETSPCLLSP